ncbi:hypothetical protein AVEN_232141-1 [Araneus ventricosus]|uniref:Uncharacterized protein n=1 Tax=Araneus ventricosus TaxID=182803 RepID=A0A4Y2RF37_ARAVE|nr:hypothetical protein AVEN_232141-1 [Araneus ventricosus]
MMLWKTLFCDSERITKHLTIPEKSPEALTTKKKREKTTAELICRTTRLREISRENQHYLSLGSSTLNTQLLDNENAPSLISNQNACKHCPEIERQNDTYCAPILDLNTQTTEHHQSVHPILERTEKHFAKESLTNAEKV